MFTSFRENVICVFGFFGYIIPWLTEKYQGLTAIRQKHFKRLAVGRPRVLGLCRFPCSCIQAVEIILAFTRPSPRGVAGTKWCLLRTGVAIHISNTVPRC